MPIRAASRHRSPLRTTRASHRLPVSKMRVRRPSSKIRQGRTPHRTPGRLRHPRLSPHPTPRDRPYPIERVRRTLRRRERQHPTQIAPQRPHQRVARPRPPRPTVTWCPRRTVRHRRPPPARLRIHRNVRTARSDRIHRNVQTAHSDRKPLRRRMIAARQRIRPRPRHHARPSDPIRPIETRRHPAPAIRATARRATRNRATAPRRARATRKSENPAPSPRTPAVEPPTRPTPIPNRHERLDVRTSRPDPRPIGRTRPNRLGNNGIPRSNRTVRRHPAIPGRPPAIRPRVPPKQRTGPSVTSAPSRHPTGICRIALNPLGSRFTRIRRIHRFRRLNAPLGRTSPRHPDRPPINRPRTPKTSPTQVIRPKLTSRYRRTRWVPRKALRMMCRRLPSSTITWRTVRESSTGPTAHPSVTIPVPIGCERTPSTRVNTTSSCTGAPRARRFPAWARRFIRNRSSMRFSEIRITNQARRFGCCPASAVTIWAGRSTWRIASAYRCAPRRMRSVPRESPTLPRRFAATANSAPSIRIRTRHIPAGRIRSTPRVSCRTSSRTPPTTAGPPTMIRPAGISWGETRMPVRANPA